MSANARRRARYAYVDLSRFAADVLVTLVPEPDAPSNAIGSLLLAVEVLSPSSARPDRQAKRRLYQRVAVPEYCILDIDARLIERWRPTDQRQEIATRELTWAPDGMLHPLLLDVADLFARVWRD